MRITPKIRFESDWFAIDRDGRVGFFAGGDVGIIPRAADLDRTDEAVAALAKAAAAAAAATSALGDGYRDAARQTNEPIFDLPPFDEKPTEGYPHLVFANDPIALRDALVDVDVREALSTSGVALVVATLYEFTWELLHEGICIGCRALSDPRDPRPRAPELLARAGLYVFAHSGFEADAPYLRVASPSVPADSSDLEAIVVALANRVPLRESFAETATITI